MKTCIEIQHDIFENILDNIVFLHYIIYIDDTYASAYLGLQVEVGTSRDKQGNDLNMSVIRSYM